MPSTTTFGASVVPHPGDGTLQRSLPVYDTPDLTPVVSRNGDLPQESPYLDKAPPLSSPFYQHPPASFERVPSQAATQISLSVMEKGLEPGDDDNPFASKISVDHNKECKMWPSKQTLLQSHLAEKQQKRTRRGCAGYGVVKNRWARCTKREQLLAKLLLAAIIIGIIVAVAVGITVAVKGTVYGKSGTQPVGNGQQ